MNCKFTLLANFAIKEQSFLCLLCKWNKKQIQMISLWYIKATRVFARHCMGVKWAVDGQQTFFLFLNPKLFYLLVIQLWQLFCISLFSSNQYFWYDVSIRAIGIYLADLIFQIQIIKYLPTPTFTYFGVWNTNLLYNWYFHEAQNEYFKNIS